LLRVVVTIPRSVLVSSTVAPVTIDPEASVIRPVIVPVAV